MTVRVLKPCYCVPLHRYVHPGEIVTVPTERRAIEAGLVEEVIPIPDHVPDMKSAYD